MDQIRGEARLIGEDELINRVKAGESELFGQLLDPYARKMYVLTYSILHNAHDAEETAQESALKAFTRLSQLRASSSFKCWLLQITINEARMRKRHGQLHPSLSIDDEQKNPHDGSGIVLQLADHRENPEQALERKELEAAVDHACNELTPKYQKILRLRCEENLSISEIGAALNLGIPAVKTQLHRARLNLRKQLGSVLPVEPGYRAACMRSCSHPQRRKTEDGSVAQIHGVAAWRVWQKCCTSSCLAPSTQP